MICPNCGSINVYVSQTLQSDDFAITERIRKCSNCDYRFRTIEKWDGIRNRQNKRKKK